MSMTGALCSEKVTKQKPCEDGGYMAVTCRLHGHVLEGDEAEALRGARRLAQVGGGASPVGRGDTVGGVARSAAGRVAARQARRPRQPRVHSRRTEEGDQSLTFESPPPVAMMVPPGEYASVLTSAKKWPCCLSTYVCRRVGATGGRDGSEGGRAGW